MNEDQKDVMYKAMWGPYFGPLEKMKEELKTPSKGDDQEIKKVA
jgi:hypothetical protein